MEESLSAVGENNFGDRGDSKLDVNASYEYTLHNGYVAILTGWEKTSTSARGFVRDGTNVRPSEDLNAIDTIDTDHPLVIVTGLVPWEYYKYRIWQCLSMPFENTIPFGALRCST